MRVRTLVDNINYLELVNGEDLSGEITGISYNSKKTQPNDVFICLTGEHVDGHEYAEEAFNYFFDCHDFTYWIIDSNNPEKRQQGI